MSGTLDALRTALADRYRVERELGAGGMATVYLAHDGRHDRAVAIKVLHEDLGATLGPERFLAEIKTTARLQHPHILPLLDSGNASGLLFYVMPYVEGETLRSRLNRETQLPIEDAVRIAREVADALGFAHGHGIIHRDIKPENILLQGGHALVADFGIALAVQQAGGTRLTQTGLSLGTPQYMSPEQAMGEKTVGPAADLYALGAVTYEMLTGDPPFTGSSVQAIVAKVLSERPTPPSMVRDTVPSHVEAAVLKALAKLPADRFAGAQLFADALAAPGYVNSPTEAGQAAASQSPSASEARRTRTWMRVAAITTLTTIAATAAAILSARRLAETPLPQQYDVVLPDSAPIAFGKGSPWGESWTALAVSPRGDFVVYIADRGDRAELWYRSLLDSTARPLAGTDGAYQLAMDPQGMSVAFIAGSKLKVVSVAGGPVREIAELVRPDGIAWVTNDRVFVSDAGGPFTFDRVGGERQHPFQGPCGIPYPLSPTEVMCVNVVWRAGDSVSRPIVLRDVETGSRAAATLRGTMPVLVGKDHLVYSATDGSLIAARWLAREYAIDRRTTVLSGLRTEGGYGSRQAMVSATGTLVYVPGAHNAIGQLVRSSGRGEPIPLLVPPMRAEQFDLDREGRRIAITVIGSQGWDVTIVDLASGRAER